MTIQFEDVLSALCSEVTLSHENEAQKMYLLRDVKEARLTRDVLMAYGFDVKVYDDADNAAKFYITSPALDPALVEQKLSAALAYAVSLKQIKQSLDALSHDPVSQASDYNIVLANMPTAGKQIVIHLTHPADASSAPAPIASSKTQTAAAKPAKAKNRPTTASQSIHSGQTVGKTSYQGASNQPQSAGTWRYLYNYLGGHMATSLYVLLTLAVIMLVLFTMLTFAKSFLCPDFATEKAKQNHAWYCHNNDGQ